MQVKEPPLTSYRTCLILFVLSGNLVWLFLLLMHSWLSIMAEAQMSTSLLLSRDMIKQEKIHATGRNTQYNKTEDQYVQHKNVVHCHKECGRMIEAFIQSKTNTHMMAASSTVYSLLNHPLLLWGILHLPLFQLLWMHDDPWCLTQNKFS